MPVARAARRGYGEAMQETRASRVTRGRGRWRRLGRRVSRERLWWAVRIRAAVITLFLGLAVVARVAGLLATLTPIAAAAAAGALMNAVAGVCVHRWRGIGPMIFWSGAGDVALITSVVWATGGTHSPFLFLYALQVVTAALVLGVRVAALGGGTGLVLLALALRAGATWPLAADAPGDAPERVIWLVSLTLTLALLGFIGGHLTRRLARTERELAGAHGKLARSHRRLARAHCDLQETYARLARTEAQLVAAEKMRAFGVLVAGVAHELGNPLTVLAGNLEPLAEMIDDAVARGADHERTGAAPTDEWIDEAPLLVANCRDATARAVALLAQLRSFGRGPRASELRLAPLRPGLESTLALVRHRFPDRVRVTTRWDDVPDVACDPAELNQVFMNLLLNAADALAPAGTLAVELARDGDDVVVRVRDDGPGIPADVLPRVFEPFFTTKEVGRGTGLGLAISHAIVTRHGGRLEACSPTGGGAELVVRLPVPNGRETALDAERSTPEVGRRAGVEPVAEPVTEEVEGQDGAEDREPGEDREMRSDEHERPAVVQHRAP